MTVPQPKLVKFHTCTTEGNVYVTKVSDISDQSIRDILELMFTDFFNSTNCDRIEVEFIKPRRATKTVLKDVSQARTFLRFWLQA